MGKIRISVLVTATVGAALAACLFVFITASDSAQAAFPGENGKITFAGYDGSNYDLYTIPSKGGSPTKLTNNTWLESAPSFSPDGQKIVYTVESGSNQGIYTMPSSGGTLTYVTGGRDPSFSPDGQTIAYIASGASGYGIHTIPSSGGTPTKLTNNTEHYEYEPSFSSDGQTIVYAGYDYYYDDSSGFGYYYNRGTVD